MNLKKNHAIDHVINHMINHMVNHIVNYMDFFNRVTYYNIEIIILRLYHKIIYLIFYQYNSIRVTVPLCMARCARHANPPASHTHQFLASLVALPPYM